MKGRLSTAPFLLIETLLLLALLVPVVHVRSFGERLWLSESLPDVSPNEGLFILLRTMLMVAALQVCFAFRDLYRWTVIVRPQLVVVRLVEALITVLIAVPLLHYALVFVDRQLALPGHLSRLQVHPLLVMASCGVAFLAAYGLRMRWPRWIRAGGLAERIVVIGTGAAVDVVLEEVRRRRNPAIDLVGVLASTPGPLVIGRPEDVVDVCRRTGVQRVVLDHAADVPADALMALREAELGVMDIGSLYERLTGRLSVERLEDPNTFLGGAGTPSQLGALGKRVLDLVVTLVLMLLATPVMLATAILIKLDSKGPVFYRQERIGLNQRPFWITKFRSMRTDAETASGPVWAAANDTRITRVGKWIRKLRIDELPQLWSVIMDDMALVGPRPERSFFVDELGRRMPLYNQRHLVKPGVTGWAQINHSYGNTDDDAFIKLQFDLYYVLNRSLALDISIILRTVKVVVLQQGAV